MKEAVINVKKIWEILTITLVLLLAGCSGHEDRIASDNSEPQIASNNSEPQLVFCKHAGYQNPDARASGWMPIYLWGQIENASLYTGEEIKEYVENQFDIMQLSTSEGDFNIKNPLLSIEEKNDVTYNFSYTVYIEPTEKPFNVYAVKYFDKSNDELKDGNCGEIKVHPRYYCEPKIAFCYEAPIKALDNKGNNHFMNYYIALPTLNENTVNFSVEGEGCSVESFEEDFDAEKDLIIMYENEKTKEELEGLRVYRVELNVNVEQKNMVVDPIIQIEINDNYYSCMTHPIILYTENRSLPDAGFANYYNTENIEQPKQTFLKYQ